jgi:RNA polymerase sigma-70 factor, ECF subfamily
MKPSEALIPSKSSMETGPAPAVPPPGPEGPEPGHGGDAPEDRELVRRAQAGDGAAFRRLVDRHADRAYALALRIVRSASDAEEVAQDAFVRAWRGLPRFRGDSAFSSWLYRIVARRAFDRVAVLKGRRGREEPVESMEQLPVGSAPPDDDAAARARQLARMVESLGEVQRLVVTLYYFQDRSVEEVAKTLHMPENTVKTHLSRARAALRTAWTEAEGGR